MTCDVKKNSDKKSLDLIIYLSKEGSEISVGYEKLKTVSEGFIVKQYLFH